MKTNRTYSNEALETIREQISKLVVTQAWNFSDELVDLRTRIELIHRSMGRYLNNFTYFSGINKFLNDVFSIRGYSIVEITKDELFNINTQYIMEPLYILPKRK